MGEEAVAAGRPPQESFEIKHLVKPDQPFWRIVIYPTALATRS